MEQLKRFLKRVAKPSVLISIASQVSMALMIFKIEVDMDAVNGLIMAGCNLLVLLGIVSDPGAKNPGYKDDELYCKTCGTKKIYTSIAGKMVCKDCGTPYEAGVEPPAIVE